MGWHRNTHQRTGHTGLGHFWIETKESTYQSTEYFGYSTQPATLANISVKPLSDRAASILSPFFPALISTPWALWRQSSRFHPL